MLQYTDDHLCYLVQQLCKRDKDLLFDKEAKELVEELMVRFDINRKILEEQRIRLEEIDREAYKNEELHSLEEANRVLKDQLKDKIGLTLRERNRLNEWTKQHEESDKTVIHTYSYVLHPLGDTGRYICNVVRCSCGAECIVI